MPMDDSQMMATPEPVYNESANTNSPDKKKNTIEVIVMIVLCVVVVLVFLIQSKKSAKPAAPAKTTASNNTTAATTSSTTTSSEASSGSSSKSTPKDNLVLAPLLAKGTLQTRDPFAPQVKMDAATAGNKASSNKNPVARTASRRGRGNLPISLPVAVRGLAELPRFPITNSGASVASPQNDLMVTGIISGSPSVAILRGGTHERQYVQVGDVVDNNMKVLSIRRNSVLLRAGRKNVILTLGGKNDAGKS